MPSTYTTNPPQGRVNGAHVELSFRAVDPSPEQVKGWVNEAVGRLRRWVGYVNAEVDDFNGRLNAIATAAVNQRIKKARADQDLVSSLGVPIRRREDAPSTYVAPSIRRKPDVRKSTAAARRASPPEPTMAVEEYEHVLGVIKGMVDVVERSPSAFAHMKEEHLRDHFLVQLNGQYEGAATGETFNFEGKTDIYVRVDGRSVFIAECKFWDGPKLLTQTIDQLLNYTSWRDTKTAIIVFNRGKNLSTVLEKIEPTVASHPNFVRALAYPDETGFRFVLRHRDDPDRHLTLTVLVFELPSGPPREPQRIDRPPTPHEPAHAAARS